MEDSLDFSAALGKVQEMLSDEDGQNRIQSILSSLTGNQGSDAVAIPDDGEDSPLIDKLFSQSNPSDSFDIDMFLKLQRLMSMMKSNKNSPQTEFLQKLKPFLKSSRQDRLDRAVKLINAFHLIKLFKGINEGSD